LSQSIESENEEDKREKKGGNPGYGKKCRGKGVEAKWMELRIAQGTMAWTNINRGKTRGIVGKKRNQRWGGGKKKSTGLGIKGSQKGEEGGGLATLREG